MSVMPASYEIEGKPVVKRPFEPKQVGAKIQS